MNTAEKIIRLLPYYWVLFITKTEKRHVFFKILSVAIFIFISIVGIDYYASYYKYIGFSVWTVRWWIWGALFVGSVWFIYDEHVNKILFYAMFIWLIIINYILWILPMILLIYLIYLLLESHRIKRLKEIADSTPEKIAGIKNRPKVILQVRKD